ncbi:class I SAM-dependent methyltransferase [Hufsiella ginkgonis]|uniref:Methyltransferase domain-containing protein n=1 Tax=Hufsiella ginkgonis TaxID=2695274 RepID=A0A7K1XRU9_9SPHI|nr:class I SAM-dependent methyltransferase [Hufsiella ginkgonis]MXV13713.1 methyltransferase domain-containing protein [Hufsiella ginkgonis]
MSQYKDFNFNTSDSPQSHQYLGQGLLRLLDPQKNKCILDIGCGNGALTHFLIRQGLDCYGVDASVTGITYASKDYPERFAIMDVSSQQLPDKLSHLAFDTIISTEVIEHLYDPRGFVKLCKSLLPQQGGQLILSTPYHGYLKNLLVGVSGSWDRHMDPLFDGGHIKMWSRATLSRLLEEQGFKVTDFIGCGRLPYLWKSMLIRGVLS